MFLEDSIKFNSTPASKAVPSGPYVERHRPVPFHPAARRGHRERRGLGPVAISRTSIPSPVAATGSARMGDAVGDETLAETRGVMRRESARRSTR